MSNQATALNEYQNELVRFLQPLITEGIQSIYKSAREFCEKNQSEEEILSQFQRGLKQIPHWSQMIIQEETARIVKEVGCLSNLMKLIFVTKVEILSNLNKDDDEYIKVRIPELCVFLHKIYVHTARFCFTEPELLYHKYSLRERERNIKEVYKCIREAILQTIHELFFLGDILQDPLQQVKYKKSNSAEKNILPPSPFDSVVAPQVLHHSPVPTTTASTPILLPSSYLDSSRRLTNFDNDDEEEEDELSPPNEQQEEESEREPSKERSSSQQHHHQNTYNDLFFDQDMRHKQSFNSFQSHDSFDESNTNDDNESSRPTPLFNYNASNFPSTRSKDHHHETTTFEFDRDKLRNSERSERSERDNHHHDNDHHHRRRRSSSSSSYRDHDDRERDHRDEE